jgi:hemerythrin
MYVEWKDEYSVGVARFDEGHKKLCAIISELHAGILQGKGGDTQKEVLKGLVEYTMVHFGDEEQLMKEYGYPDRLAHKLEHDGFRDKLLEFVDAYLQGSVPLTVDLLAYLVEWLEKHMMGTDKKYQKFFSSKAVT